MQGLYKCSTEDGKHERSYLYLRAGISIKNLSFGIGANLDKYGPPKNQIIKENYGVFTKADLF